MQQHEGYRGAIARASRAMVAQRLMELADNADADAQVRAEASAALRRMAKSASGPIAGRDAAESASRRAIADDIARFLARPAATRVTPKWPELPPGPPI